MLAASIVGCLSRIDTKGNRPVLGEVVWDKTSTALVPASAMLYTPVGTTLTSPDGSQWDWEELGSMLFIRSVSGVR